VGGAKEQEERAALGPKLQPEQSRFDEFADGRSLLVSLPSWRPSPASSRFFKQPMALSLGSSLVRRAAFMGAGYRKGPLLENSGWQVVNALVSRFVVFDEIPLTFSLIHD
jgi:hypothetical protein